MISLIYVSRPLIDYEQRNTILDDIQAVSVAYNSTHDITGALISTTDYFIQLLEGPASSIDEVMARILADPRHNEVRIVRRCEVEARLLPTWRMARFDGESFGKMAIAPLAAAAHDQHDPETGRKLEQMIAALASAIPVSCG